MSLVIPQGKNRRFKKNAQMERPEIVRDEHLDFLDQLRESGVTNMFGAAPHLQDAFPDELNKQDARQVLLYWMETFSERHKDE